MVETEKVEKGGVDEIELLPGEIKSYLEGLTGKYLNIDEEDGTHLQAKVGTVVVEANEVYFIPEDDSINGLVSFQNDSERINFFVSGGRPISTFWPKNIEKIFNGRHPQSLRVVKIGFIFCPAEKESLEKKYLVNTFADFGSVSSNGEIVGASTRLVLQKATVKPGSVDQRKADVFISS